MKRLNNFNVQNAAEHAVCAELHRRGAMAVITPGNAPGIDILVNLENRSPVSIQVKASRGDTQPLCWLLGNKTFAENKSFFYVFVNVWSDIEKPIEFFVVPSTEVRSKLLGSGWAKISLGRDADKYRNNWESILAEERQ